MTVPPLHPFVQPTVGGKHKVQKEGETFANSGLSSSGTVINVFLFAIACWPAFSSYAQIYLIDLVKCSFENNGFHTGGSYWNQLLGSWIN